MRAADLFAKGVSQADIGRELEVSHQTVSDWHESGRSEGSRR
jgi:DNA-binding transcriptional regulator YiaG